VDELLIDIVSEINKEKEIVKDDSLQPVLDISIKLLSKLIFDSNID
jgi:hypothetical protein